MPPSVTFTSAPPTRRHGELKDKQVVSVKVDTDGRSLIFGDVFVRVSDKFITSMHIDTDEANAAGISGEVYGEIIV